MASEGTLAPGLLVAMPQLPDPNFYRSVCLMIEHNDRGSFGLVVNRPTELAIEEVLGQFKLRWRGDPAAVVWQGGPVEPQLGSVLHAPRAGASEVTPSLEVVPGIQLSTLPDQLRELAERPPAHLRFLLGYAGWGPGQLESEMAYGSWLVAPATPRLVFEIPAEGIWEAAIQSLGIDPVTLIPGEGIH